MRTPQFEQKTSELVSSLEVNCTEKKSGAVLENGATLEGGAVFSLIIMFRKKMAPPSEVALFLGENSSTFGSGTKIVPQVKLS